MNDWPWQTAKNTALFHKIALMMGRRLLPETIFVDINKNGRR
jgi:hypothetical protein